MRLRSQSTNSILVCIFNKLSQIVNWVYLSLVRILQKIRLVSSDTWSRANSLFLNRHLLFGHKGSEFKLMVTTSNLRLFKLRVKWWRASCTFLSIHRWIFTVIVSNRSTKVSLAAIGGEKWNNRFGANISEIWRRFECAISANLCPASFLRLRGCVSDLKLPPAIEVAVVLQWVASIAVLIHHH